MLGKLLRADYPVRFVWKASPRDVLERMAEFELVGE
jgi:hypothetical protein